MYPGRRWLQAFLAVDPGRMSNQDPRARSSTCHADSKLDRPYPAVHHFRSLRRTNSRRAFPRSRLLAQSAPTEQEIAELALTIPIGESRVTLRTADETVGGPT